MEAPLEGLRVLDASRVLAGPYAAMMLGDLGADVTKVEHPQGGDQTRVWGPPYIDDQSAYYLSINRNKRSITLNLKSEKGKEIFRKLAEQSDVLVENFRPGGMEKLGLGYDELKKINPGLIQCSVTGYGHTGPWKDRPAYDIVLQAEGGLMSITGEKDCPPVRIGVALIDIITALYATQGILAALRTREREGVGQRIDVAMLDCEVASLTYMAGYYFATGEVPERIGSRHPTIVPYQAYETKDSYIVVGGGSPDIWQSFCKAIDKEELANDPKFRDNPNRVRNREKLEIILKPIFKAKTTKEWVKIMDAYDVPATPVNDLAQVFALSHVKERNMSTTIEHPPVGELKILGIPVKFEKTPGKVKRHPPLLGEHTEEILGEIGYSKDAIEDLYREGVI